MAAKETLDRQDAAFAERLSRRDQAVLREIEQAYGDQLRRLVARFRGPLLNGHDIDEVISLALKDAWDDFAADKRSSVRSFYFRVGKRRLQDRLRQNSRRRDGIARYMALVGQSEVEEDSAADHLVLDQESQASNKAVMRLVDDAVTSLTTRQRVAYVRRSCAGGGAQWAKQLEGETGTPAKQWRKASDEALKNIRGYLIERGVYYSQEGGCYAVA